MLCVLLCAGGPVLQRQQQLRHVGSLVAETTTSSLDVPAATAVGDAASAGGSSSMGQEVPSEAAQMAAVSYLTEHVLTSRPVRHPTGNVLLPTLAASNASVKEYRDKTAAYVASDAFKQRWDALKTQVSVPGVVCVGRCVCVCLWLHCTACCLCKSACHVKLRQTSLVSSDT